MDARSLLFSTARHGHDIRMTLDRILSPENAHPLVRDLLESIRECRLGEAQLALAFLRTQLEVDFSDFQRLLSPLLFANATHSSEPEQAFQYLLDIGLSPVECATHMMEHLALGHFFAETGRTNRLLSWFADKGGMVLPESRAAWQALERHYPDQFAANHSRLEAMKLDAYIRSQSLEVREMVRL